MHTNEIDPEKRAEDYAIGSIFDYSGTHTLVKTERGWWTIRIHDYGWFGSWSDAEVNMGLYPGGSVTPVYDNGR